MLVAKILAPTSGFVNGSEILIIMYKHFRPEECRHMLTQFGQREITPESVAKVLGMMARTPSALPDQPPGQVGDTFQKQMSRFMRKPGFFAADQHLCFLLIDSTIPLHPKLVISSR